MLSSEMRPKNRTRLQISNFCFFNCADVLVTRSYFARTQQLPEKICGFRIPALLLQQRYCSRHHHCVHPRCCEAAQVGGRFMCGIFRRRFVVPG